jgi:uncharacterized membrane-anchored protein
MDANDSDAVLRCKCPLTIGDFLDQPVSHGGLNLSRPLASAVIAIFIVGCILFLPQRAGQHPIETQPI